MCVRRRRAAGRRCARFEPLESRRLLSVQPAYDIRLSHHVEAPIRPDQVESRRDTYASWADLERLREQYGLFGTDQTVAIIDSGIAYDHPALGGGLGTGFRVVGGWDFTEENDDDPYDDAPAGFHGTHVAGIVGSSDTRFPGVAPGTDLVALRVFNDQGNGRLEWVEKALAWVHEHRFSFAHPITAVNLSLGSTWNSESVPDWGRLEDELAQLKADGIFVAASAGNDFRLFTAPGLTYPASSPHVVPVASLNADGELSDFSQRSPRALAAPGEDITSTVPDYLYGFDGRTDDFASSSGTSMAAPFVAGASAILREAIELVTQSAPSPDTLYNIFRQTAAIHTDPLTDLEVYAVDLLAAVESVLPTDEFGDQIDSAHPLASLASATTLTGWINTRSDRDVFVFTADVSGTLSATVEAGGHLIPNLIVESIDAALGAGSTFQVDADSSPWSVPVVAGQRYAVHMATTGGIGSYELTLQIEPSAVPEAIDLGPVDLAVVEVRPTSGGVWYRAEAVRDGWFTAEWSPSTSGATYVTLSRDPASAVTPQSTISGGAAGTSRQDLQVRQGETVWLRIEGDQPLELRLANLLEVRDGEVHVHGTAGDDSVEIDWSGPLQVSVGGTAYALPEVPVTRVVVHASEGHDTLRVIGTAGDDRASLAPGSLAWQSAGKEIEASADEIIVYGGGGADRAALEDSSESDQLFAKPDLVRLTTPSGVSAVHDFGQVAIKASLGQDTVRLYDSSGDDLLVAEPGRVNLSGPGFQVEALGFDHAFAYATAGGNDQAVLRGGAGNDQFFARPEAAFLISVRHVFYSAGFEHVRAEGTGGEDTAHLYAGGGDDLLNAGPEHARLTGDGYAYQADGFQQLWVYGGGGQNRAELRGTDGNDTFHSSASESWMASSGHLLHASNFSHVVAIGGGGDDVAELVDAPGSDHLTARPGRVELRGAQREVRAEGFRQVTARATEGGEDVAELFDSTGDDVYEAGPAFARMQGTHFQHTALGFSRVVARSSAGRDRAELTGSTGAERLIAAWRYALWTGSGFRHEVTGFANLQAEGGGGDDRAELYDLQEVDRFYAEDRLATVTRNGDTLATLDFAYLSARARQGQSPTVDVQAVDFVLDLYGLR